MSNIRIANLSDEKLIPDVDDFLVLDSDKTYKIKQKNLLRILPNNIRINNIEHFYQTTKPTTRGDGSALVIGDRWWKNDTGEEWFWNGTYWLSPIERYSVAWTGPINTTNNTVALLPQNSSPKINGNLNTRVFIHRAGLIFSQYSLNWDATNYWRVILRKTGDNIPPAFGNEDLTITIFTSNAPSTSPFVRIIGENIVSPVGIMGLSFGFAKFGNPSDISRGNFFVFISTFYED